MLIGFDNYRVQKKVLRVLLAEIYMRFLVLKTKKKRRNDLSVMWNEKRGNHTGLLINDFKNIQLIIKMYSVLWRVFSQLCYLSSDTRRKKNKRRLYHGPWSIKMFFKRVFISIIYRIYYVNLIKSVCVLWIFKYF